MDVARRVSDLEGVNAEQQVLNARLISRVDGLEYHLALLLKKNPDVWSQARDGFGVPFITESMIAGPGKGDQNWLWIDNRATSISERAFVGSAVSEVVSSENSRLESIEGFAFGGCSQLRCFEVPRSVKAIGSWAFAASSLANVCFAEGSMLGLVGNGAFCAVECQAVHLPRTVRSLGERAFLWCERLVEVSFGEDSQLSSIGAMAFCDCVSLRAIDLPQRVVEVPIRCFEHCASLEKVEFAGHSITTIAAGAFNGCSRLRTIALPPSVQILGSLASSVEARGDKSVVMVEDMEVKVKHLGCFANCVSLEEVVFGERSSLKKIGERCFDGCAKLKCVGRSPRLKWLGPRAFSRCKGLTRMSLPNGMMQIGEAALAGCEAVTEVQLPCTLEVLGRRAFANCIRLRQVRCLPNARLREVGDGAFAGCCELTALTLSKSVVKVGRAVVPRGCKMVAAVSPTGALRPFAS